GLRTASVMRLSSTSVRVHLSPRAGRGSAGVAPALPIQPLRLAFGDLDRTLSILATGARIGEHVEHDEVGERRRRLLADRSLPAPGPPAVSVRLAASRKIVFLGSAVQIGLLS